MNMTQLDLAYAIGTSPNQIYRYESGENDPSASMLIKLVKALNASSDYLLAREDAPKLREEEDEIMQRILEEYLAGNLIEVVEIVLIEIRKRYKDEHPTTR